MPRVSVSHAAARAVMAVEFALLVACGGRAERPSTPPPVVATWIQVYPAQGALDTLVLHADGRLTGSTTGLDSVGFAHERWQVGAALMPNGLCFGETQPTRSAQQARQYCQGWRVAGDTLWLANQNRTTFLRASSDGYAPLAAWESPRGAAVAPAPGDSVAGQSPDVRTP